MWIWHDRLSATIPVKLPGPVYVRRDDRIKAHFLTCFLALLIYKYLEKKVNRGGEHFTTQEIVETLRSMDFLSVCGEGYIPTCTRTNLTNHLHGSAGFRTDTQIVTKQKMRSIIAQTKRREKVDNHINQFIALRCSSFQVF